MNAAQRIDHATARLHAAIDAMLIQVVANAGAPLDAPPERRADVTEIAVERLLADLERAHPGVVAS